MNLVFLGPPGAGKGTQAIKFSQQHGIAHLSTGDILRQATKEQTPLGKLAEFYMTQGKLVPDDVVIDLVASVLNEEQCKNGFILDGFPRTVPQAEALDQKLLQIGREIDCVVFFEISEAFLIKRLSQRRTCQQCGTIYHLTYQPPKQANRCDVCGGIGTLFQRPDDQENAIYQRLNVYKKQTEPLIAYYEKRNILSVVSAENSIDYVAQSLGSILGAIQKNGAVCVV